ncbi:hypothetical protein PND93_02825 [Faecalicoccus pleomorphus]|uniref:hypothetical protein n=1 Tax=Faecalicoccus pleomorphus TaxID=1323 RepID=UPI00232D36FF|nr:hypothetical protein [Faecalicoccus pleomorphus]MDB7990518.1 hypothetical protein [Faecalicoccus pleomorphus]
MNKVIEMLMEELDVGICEDFRVKPSVAGQSEYKGIYHFDELGALRRDDGISADSVLGFLARGRLSIEKVKPKGRYIPKKGELYYFVGNYGEIIESRHNTEQDEFLFKHNLLFITEEEARDYKWFLDQVDKYKKEFVKDKDNYCLYFDVDYKRLEIDYNHRFKYDLSYFGDGENIKEFISVVGEERIKKYMFNVWE